MIEHFEEGDVILADRGFQIDDLCREKKASLVIPPFLKGKQAFSPEETRKTKLIAKARIHVERFNRRLKSFKLLTGIIPLTLLPMLSQIIFVVCCLVNFQKPLAK
jgi:hypothetical protein